MSSHLLQLPSHLACGGVVFSLAFGLFLSPPARLHSPSLVLYEEGEEERGRRKRGEGGFLEGSWVHSFLLWVLGHHLLFLIVLFSCLMGSLGYKQLWIHRHDLSNHEPVHQPSR